MSFSPRGMTRLLARLLPERVKAPLRGRLFGYRPAGADLGLELEGSRARFGGIALELPPEMAADAAYHLRDNGSAVEEMYGFMREGRARGGLLIDVGAHHGLFSAVFCALGRSHRALALEPSLPLAAVARRLFAMNGLDGRAELRPALVGAASGSIATWTDEHEFIRHDPVPADRVSAVSDAVTLDQLCDGRAPTVIKIDVEGDELAVLRGAAETLRRHRPVVFLELHLDLLESRGEDVAELRALLPGHRWETPLGEPISLRQVLNRPEAVLRVVAR